MALTHSQAVQVRTIKGKGRDVFGRWLIKRDEIIERVPVTVLPAGQLGDEPGQ
jgi:hypothetical protein